ncbi:hypothetical protein PTNB73_07637 [Pyrenophora teres f. teres]|uniref:DesA n=1 Tax=Pyrenophora teres f. teres TaxID=97479 RepID=A0A6S6WCI7_9PLEO|nr:hypothetical protein HRS9122_07451 [Pyrenophora teres f. teres]KAE8858079.1 hypothetical protein PTNB29_07294 [Pyrenophora teres f. teres]KAE8862083.1 hypothetical protein PTNB73_07637 [Pyrenophora teres f. teres]CAE7208512.1 DesA [Pyrenophora teres f. teres]
MEPTINPYHTQPDIVVLGNLIQDIKCGIKGTRQARDSNVSPETLERVADDKTQTVDHDMQTIKLLTSYNDPTSSAFAPTIFTTWDNAAIPPVLNTYLVKPYARIAMDIVRHPTDIVFLTHILLYLTVNLASAIQLFRHFTYAHAIAHVGYTGWCIGSFTLLMHNHIHNNGVLKKRWKWLDLGFPYVLEPLMGHTWDSYYYHHVKHHHVESNGTDAGDLLGALGPGDLSSTIRYQRDSVFHFLQYYLRFLLLVWLELPLYFIKRGQTNLAIRALVSEVSSYIFLVAMYKVNRRAATWVFLVPFAILRLALMVGNWGQHALVDEDDPNSDFRTSITMIDVMSNRVCFNDGYHTAHHLNPRRHWRDQPVHFVRSKDAYRAGRALVFYDVDWFMMTLRLLMKDYLYLADHLVPIGDQIGMGREERADMLRAKTRRFTEEDIKRKFK